MLSENEKLLIAGLVDEQLSPTERINAERLIKCSPEAVRLLELLRKDSKEVQLLKTFKVPEGLSNRVLVKCRQNVSGLRLSSSANSSWYQYAALMAAASVLFIAGGISYLCIQLFVNVSDPTNSSIANNENKEKSLEKSKPIFAKTSDANLIQDKALNEKNMASAKPDLLKNEPDRSQIQSNEKARQKDGLLAAPSHEIISLTKVETPFPLLVRGEDLDNASESKFWSKTLKNEKSIRLEMVTKEPVRFLNQLKIQLGKNGFLSFSDVGTLVNLKNKSDKSALGHLVYFEINNPEELSSLLGRNLPSTKEKEKASKAASKNGNAVALDWMVISAATPNDSKLLKSVVGVDLLDQKNESRPSGFDSKSKSVKNALVLTYSQGQSLATSSEVKQFIEARKFAVPGKLRVLLLLRAES